MKIKKGTILKVTNEQKVSFTCIATRTFDTTERWWPLTNAKKINPLIGKNSIWHLGDEVTVKGSFYKVEIID